MRLIPLLFHFLLTTNHCNLQRNNVGNFFTSSKMKAKSHSTLLFSYPSFHQFSLTAFSFTFSFLFSFFLYLPFPPPFFPNFSYSSPIHVVSCFFPLPCCLPPPYSEIKVCSYSLKMQSRVWKGHHSCCWQKGNSPDHSGCAFRLKVLPFNITLWLISVKPPEMISSNNLML